MSKTQIYRVTTEIIVDREDTVMGTSMEDAIATVEKRLRDTYHDAEFRVVACTWQRKDQESQEEEA